MTSYKSKCISTAVSSKHVTGYRLILGGVLINGVLSAGRGTFAGGLAAVRRRQHFGSQHS